MFATLSGVDELDAQLSALPMELMARIDAKTREMAEALAAKVRDEKLSGQVLQTKSGALRNSVAAEVSAEGETVTATVGSQGDVKYAAMQEYGGQTAAHEILPDKGRVLAFLIGGAQRFAARVQHPGSLIPARPYLSSSLQEMEGEIVDTFTGAVEQAWGAL